jgi:FixJ family two-component response regulator
MEAIRCGAVDFISKPFDVADIVAVVRKSIERRNLRQQLKSQAEYPS